MSQVIHQGNRSTHSTMSVKTFRPNLDNLPPSLDLAPCEFYLFLEVKSALERTTFQFISRLKLLMKKPIEDGYLARFPI